MTTIKSLIYRAADEFHAADAARDSKVSRYHQLVAEELVKLINVDGNPAVYQILRRRSEDRTGETNLVPVSEIITAEKFAA
jgi:hypothetical protein